MAAVRRFPDPIDSPSDAQLDQLADVTDLKIERSRDRWKSEAPAELRELLDATPVLDPDEDPI
jgi:hypothetical protein